MDKYFLISLFLHLTLLVGAVPRPKVEAVPRPEIESTDVVPGKVKDPPAKAKRHDVDLINTAKKTENRKCRLIDGVMKCNPKNNKRKH
ncbi:MAG: hypothetical protein WC635_10975 [Bacteriovorax sp.]|jgi:hypothetical protein